MQGLEARADEIIRLMQKRGGQAYFGEPVSQLEHALQAAWFASRANSAPCLILAALLHDNTSCTICRKTLPKAESTPGTRRPVTNGSLRVSDPRLPNPSAPTSPRNGTCAARIQSIWRNSPRHQYRVWRCRADPSTRRKPANSKLGHGAGKLFNSGVGMTPPSNRG
jgi:hypothetical protein